VCVLFVEQNVKVVNLFTTDLILLINWKNISEIYRVLM